MRQEGPGRRHEGTERGCRSARGIRAELEVREMDGLKKPRPVTVMPLATPNVRVLISKAPPAPAPFGPRAD